MRRSKIITVDFSDGDGLQMSHQRQLWESGIEWEVIEARGYRTAKTEELLTLGFKRYQVGSGLLIPLYDPAGNSAGAVLRRDRPRLKRDRTRAKYEAPEGSELHLDVNPLMVEAIDDVSRPLLVTEGTKKVDCATSFGICALSVPGVWGWQSDKVPIADWQLVPLMGRLVYVAFDSDVMVKEPVEKALGELSTYLHERKAVVQCIYLPGNEDGSKQGVDDYLSLHSAEEMFELARPFEASFPIKTRGRRMATVAIGTARELKDMELSPPKEIVQGIVPVGLTLAAASPKIGKSWFALGLAIAIASGGEAMGSVEVEQGDVLYLALEDSPRRMKSRLQRFDQFPERLNLTYEWPKLDAGGMEALVEFLESHKQTRLIVIDIWKKVRPKRVRGAQLYDEDYEHMSLLQGVAHRFEVAILVVHHTRKSTAEDVFDEISGSTGVLAAVDAALIIHRPRTEADAELWVTGKDIEEQHRFLKFEDGYRWTLIAPNITVTKSRERRQVLEAITRLREGGRKPSAKNVAELLEKNIHTTRWLMQQMRRAGEIDGESNGIDA